MAWTGNPHVCGCHAQKAIFPTYGFIVSAFKAYIISSSSFVGYGCRVVLVRCVLNRLGGDGDVKGYQLLF